jgi:hypothetical protein
VNKTETAGRAVLVLPWKSVLAREERSQLMNKRLAIAKGFFKVDVWKVKYRDSVHNYIIKLVVSLVDIFSEHIAARQVMRIDKRLEYLVIQKHIRNLVAIGTLAIGHRLFKLVENDVCIESIQFQIL